MYHPKHGELYANRSTPLCLTEEHRTYVVEEHKESLYYIVGFHTHMPLCEKNNINVNKPPSSKRK